MNENEDINYWDFLLFGLKHYNLKIEKIEGKKIFLEHDYMIEFEGDNLYKLLHKNAVVGPFGSIEGLCEFIIEDQNRNL